MLEVLKRINTLAQKEREQGLTSEEQALRVDLRQEYLRTIREQFNKTLMGVTIYDPTGEDVTPEKLKEEQQKYLIKRDTEQSIWLFCVSLTTLLSHMSTYNHIVRQHHGQRRLSLLYCVDGPSPFDKVVLKRSLHQSITSQP